MTVYETITNDITELKEVLHRIVEKNKWKKKMKEQLFLCEIEGLIKEFDNKYSALVNIFLFVQPSLYLL